MKRLFILILIVICSAATAWTEGVNSTSMALFIEPSVDLPVASSELFTTGGSLTFGGELGFGTSFPFFASIIAGYSLSPYRADNAMHTLLAGPGAGFYFDFSDRLSLKLMASGGYYYSFINDGGTTTGGGNPFVLGGGGLQYLLTPRLNLGANVMWRQLFGLHGGLEITLGTSYFLRGQDRRQLRMEGRLPKRPDLLQERAPNPNEGIRVEKIDFQTVFPVFRNWYDTNPIGTAVLVNQEKVSITGLRANLKVAVNEKTTSSKELEVPATLKPGEKVVVNLYALLDQKVMEITEEGERKPAELVLTYNVGEQRFRDVKTPTVIFWNRNNMTWDDNRRAAAFVTVNDPRVTELAGTVLKLVDPLQTVAINKPLVAAMAVHQATILNGVKYQQDPKSKYEDLSKQKNQVDYLKYPAQTLMSSGDCDDLSILYAALLEACSIDTAFVTVPGHILIAFALPVAESEVQKNYYDSDMIFRFNDRFWVPLETIKRELSFTNAWKTGAATWKQYEDNPDFGVYPLDEAWLVYNRVQAPENLLASSTIRLPEQKPIEAAVKREIDAFKASELDPLVKKLEKDPRGPTDPSIVNKIGVLYAKYGEWDKAESAFKRITSMKENSATFSAHLNLGNTFYLRGRYTEALASYQQALKRTPSSTIAQINVARASYALNKFDDARSVYEKLAVSDPQLAAQFAYLGSKAGNTGERAGDSAAQKGVTIWDD